MIELIITVVLGLITGLVLAIPPGPVAIATIKITLSQGASRALFIAVGTALIDSIYFLIAVLGTSFIFLRFSEFIEQHSLIILIIQLLIVCGIIYFGIKNLFTKVPEDNINLISNDKSEINTLKTRPLNKYSSALMVLGLAAANIFNPTYFSSYIFLSGLALKFGIISDLYLSKILFSIAIGTGTGLWLFILSRIVLRNIKNISRKTFLYIHRFAGASLIFFGTVLGYNVVKIAQWNLIFSLFF